MNERIFDAQRIAVNGLFGTAWLKLWVIREQTDDMRSGITWTELEGVYNSPEECVERCRAISGGDGFVCRIHTKTQYRR